MEYNYRLHTFANNWRKIQAHNQRNHTFKSTGEPLFPQASERRRGGNIADLERKQFLALAGERVLSGILGVESRDSDSENVFAEPQIIALKRI